MSKIIVSDTTAITHLAKINALHLMRHLYNEIIIPDAVYYELSQVKRTQPGALDVLNAKWIKRVSIKDHTIADKLKAKIDNGESEAIALAIEKKADILIIDEVAGRAIAKQLVNKIIGMIGILLEAKKCHLIKSVKPYLEKLKSTGFRMSDKLYDLALQQAGELEHESESAK